MNLADMAAFICGKVNLTEPEDLAACKGFLARRFEMLWNDQLWKDSLVEYVQGITGTQAVSVLVPAPAANYNQFGLVYYGPGTLVVGHSYQWTPDGSEIELLGPNLTAAGYFTATQTSVAVKGGPNAPYTGQLYDVTGTTQAVMSTWLPTKSIFLCPTIIKQVIGVRTSERVLNAQDPCYYYRVDYDAWNKSGTAIEHVRLPGCVWEFDQPVDVYAVRDLADGNLMVSADLADADNCGSTRVAQALTAGTMSLGVTARVNAFRKKASTAPVKLSVALIAAGSESFPLIPIVTLGATDTSAPLRQRLRLVEIPETLTTLRVLGKRTCPPLIEDEDEPGLTSVENCLLAFAQADMLQRERHYAKAQAVAQEAAQLLQQLIEIEVVQTSHNQRIIPESGYADDYALRGLKFGF